MRLNFDQLAIVGYAHLKVHGFGEKIYAYGGLIGVVKAVVHKPLRESYHKFLYRRDNTRHKKVSKKKTYSTL